MELLYLKKDYNAPLPLSESIIKLYAAILRYLAKAKSYFSGNGASMSQFVVCLRFCQGIMYIIRC
jgi:hypothetical protein